MGERAQLARLAERYGLAGRAVDQLAELLLVLADPAAPTAVHDPARAVEIHVADSLIGLEIEALRAAATIADLGSGAGLPGLVIAIARPEASIALVEATQKRCEFLRAAVAWLELDNVEVIASRIESWLDGTGRTEVVTARALASLAVLCEYAAPLLTTDGSLLAWKGAVTAAEADGAAAAARALGLELAAPLPVMPFAGSERRTLWVARKVAPTPQRFPRRPGMATKNPLG